MKMMGALRNPTILTTITLKVHDNSSNIGNPDDFLPQKSQNHSLQHHNHLSISKPSFIVRTESNVRLLKRKSPEPCCVVCQGSGRVDCHHCLGKGRTNSTELMMLPKGEWPKWCKTCGGSGLAYCSRCLGTGEYRDIMGFHFMKRENDLPQKPAESQTDSKRENVTPADLLFSQTSTETELL